MGESAPRALEPVGCVWIAGLGKSHQCMETLQVVRKEHISGYRRTGIGNNDTKKQSYD